ncbi:uncharacterized protein LOC124170281 [Ischnura elegans]|uniref:uncharacterized protein LOC124170281 n=1 Tax=Ischnura elegans TaxID=197161 RepID=UPI001ED8A86C|nr:uncharacterized protein LOC124170281 [Ischnura elegans]
MEEGTAEYPARSLGGSAVVVEECAGVSISEAGACVVNEFKAEERDSDSPEIIFVAAVKRKNNIATARGGKVNVRRRRGGRGGHHSTAGIGVACVTSTDERVKKKRAKRRFWEHPSLAMRSESGIFQAMYEDLRQHPEKFFDFYGMSISTFDELLSSVKIAITKKDTVARMAITAEERLSVTLRYLIHGINFSFLGKDFMIGRSTISGIVRETCAAILKALQPKEMPEPTTEDWTRISEEFYHKTSFPNCLGAVDGRQVKIVSSQAVIVASKKFKNCNSVVVMGVADANYKFTAVEVGLFSGDEGGEFSIEKSSFGSSLLAKSLAIPLPCPPPNSERALPFVFIGREDFPPHENILQPYAGKDLKVKCSIFNNRLARAYSSIDCALAILCHKFKLLRVGLTVAPEFGMSIVKTICILHNFLGERDGLNMDDSFACSLEDYALFRSEVEVIAEDSKSRREEFADYFVSPAGEVSWQTHGVEKHEQP